ncbi:MAG TPA: site-2 protease family protein [Anaerovoracaceae bacterium]|nr:site-2 protease family protein [Anaerovoracaceae bacterium]
MRFLRNNPLVLLLILYMAYQSFTRQQFANPMDWLMDKLIILPAILIGLAFHEFAHAFAADRLGDRTPRMQGRVTLNPAAHIDPFGLLALFFIGFGWGKPVMVDERNFKHSRRDGLIVDLAGVTMNLFLAIAFTGILRLLAAYQYDFLNTSLGSILIEMLFAVISINIVLMIFNLLPVPPLDGFGIVTEIFNLREKEWYYQVYNNGFMILLLLIVFNVTGKVLGPAVDFVFDAVMGIFF